MSACGDEWTAGPEAEFETALKRKRLRNRPFYLFLRAVDFLEKGKNREARVTLERALAITDPDQRDFDKMRIETELAPSTGRRRLSTFISSGTRSAGHASLRLVVS